MLLLLLRLVPLLVLLLGGVNIARWHVDLSHAGDQRQGQTLGGNFSGGRGIGAGTN